MRRDLHLVEPAMAPYFQDVYDHVLRVAEWTDALRDLVGNIRETSMTQQSHLRLRPSRRPERCSRSSWPGWSTNCSTNSTSQSLDRAASSNWA
ncbi:CorA family divalent cation transporter [Nonomuraea dietziae]